MKKIIHHIRKQPEELKRHILHILTFVSGVVLVLLWIYSLENKVDDVDTQVRTGQDLKPLSVLKDNIINGYKGIVGPSLNVEQSAQ